MRKVTLEYETVKFLSSTTDKTKNWRDKQQTSLKIVVLSSYTQSVLNEIIETSLMSAG